MDGAPIATVMWSGFASKPSWDGSGQRGEWPSTQLAIRSHPASQRQLPDLDVELHHRSPSELATATIRCTARESEPNGCPDPQGRASTLVVPDSYGAPAWLGAGPFLGRRVDDVPSWQFDPWEPASPSSVEWRLGSRVELGGRACVRLDALQSDRNPKTSTVFWPLWGSLVLCNGLAVPAVVAQGPLVLTLETVDDRGGDGAAFPPASLPPARSDCAARGPPTSDRALNVADWWEWGRDHDPFVRRYLERHPAARPMPGYGLLVTDPPDVPFESHAVTATMVLADRESWELVVRLVHEQWSRISVLPPEGKMLPSDAIGGVGPTLVAPPTTALCQGVGGVESRLGKVLEIMGHDVRLAEVSLAPDVAGAWQGSWRPTWPFSTMFPALATATRPAPWPERAFVTVTADGGFAVSTVHASVDPATGWIRWFSRNPAAV